MIKDGTTPDWYVAEQVNKLDSPALVFYPDRIASNIQRLIDSIDQISRLRPHVKTHKSAEITMLMINAGISRFKCATIAEAEMLGSCAATDVLLAYQPVGPKIDRYLALVKTFPLTRFSCLVDNPYSMQELSLAAIQSGTEINVFLDLNLGMNRTGVLPDETALTLYRQMSVVKGIRVLGLHGYDGHIHDSSLAERKKNWQPVWNAIQNLKEKIVADGLKNPLIIAGGTPTYPFYAEQADVECSPGTFALWDKSYHGTCAEQDYDIAAVLISRIISLPDETKICLDLGHKAVAAENELTKRVSFLNAAGAKIISHSEEHLVLEMPEGHGFKIGDVLYGLPIHICPTVALYDKAATVSKHKIDGEWTIISRKRKINI